MCLGFGSGMSVVNPGPKFPPSKGEVWPKPQEESKEMKYFNFSPMHFAVKVCKDFSSLIKRTLDFRFIKIKIPDKAM